jgi:hypothetical protein
MNMENNKLSVHAKNIHSQHGEDGIIEMIFELIGTTSRVCIEFGAWDGFHLSNTANLWMHGWKGVLIEGVTSRYEELKQNVKDYDCLCLNAFVTRAGLNSLDAIATRSGIGPDVDLLSIDIDGDDYYIFESLEWLRPRVIICEYNPTIPAEIDLCAEYGSYFGSSVAALSRLAKTKSYSLVAITETNCIFVQDALVPALANYEMRLDRIKSDKQLVYLITNYAGDYVVSGCPPYGISIPYSGRLLGLYSPFPNGAGVRGVGIRLYRAFRYVWKKIFSTQR